LKIYPGHGRRVVKADGKLLIFLNSKCEANYYLKRVPWEICWTVLYRRRHKKGQQEEVKKKKVSRRTVKFQRAIKGASLADIIRKRTMAPEARQQQRDQAIKAAKDKQRQKDAAKKAAKLKEQKAAQQAQQKQAKVPKQAPKGRPTVGVAR